MSSVTSVNQEEEKKPLVQSTHINLKVKSQVDGNEYLFRFRRTCPLEILKKEFCERMSLDIKAIVLLYDGHFINLRQTPAQLEMEEGDQLDAMLHMTGGAVIKY